MTLKQCADRLSRCSEFYHHLMRRIQGDKITTQKDLETITMLQAEYNECRECCQFLDGLIQSVGSSRSTAQDNTAIDTRILQDDLSKVQRVGSGI